MAAKSGLENIMDLIGLFAPKGGGTQTTTGSTTTTKSNTVDPKAAQAIIDSILSGPQGLAAISQGQRSSGLYNSTVNQQLTNDLTARAAAEVAKLNSTETTTTTPNTTTTTTPTAQVSPGTGALGLLGLGANSLFGPTLKAGVKKFGLDDLGGDLASSLFGSSTPDFAPAPAGASNFFFDSLPSVADFGSGSGISFEDIAPGSEFFDFGSDVFDDLLGDVGGDFFSGAADFFGGLFADGGRVPKKEVSGRINFYANGGRVGNNGKKVAPKKQAMPVRKFANGGSLSPDMKMRMRIAAGERPQRLGVMNYRSQVPVGALPNELQLDADTLFNPNDITIGDAPITDNITPGNFDAGLYTGKNPNVGVDEFGGLTDTSVYAQRDSMVAEFAKSALGLALGGVGGIGTIANLASKGITGNSLWYNLLTGSFQDQDTAMWENTSNYIDSITAENFSVTNPNPQDPYAVIPEEFRPDDLTAGYSGGGYYGDLGGGFFDPVSGGGGGDFGLGTGFYGVDLGALDDYDNELGNAGYGYHANGGKLGPGTSRSRTSAGKLPGHDTKGKDAVPAIVKGGGKVQLSGGEFIIPTDVVDAVGEEFFNGLLQKFHTPV